MHPATLGCRAESQGQLDPMTVLLSEVSDWMEQSAHVIRICGERYTPPHKWSHLRGAAKLMSASAVRDLSGLGEPWVTIRAQYNVPVAMGTAQAVDHIVAESARRRALFQENCRHLHKVVDKIEIEARDYSVCFIVKREIIWQSGTACARPKKKKSNFKV